MLWSLLSRFRYYLDVYIRQSRASVEGLLNFPQNRVAVCSEQSRAGRQCLVSAQGQSQECYVSLSFCSLSLSLPCFLELVPSPVSNPPFLPSCQTPTFSLLSPSVVKPSSSGSAVKHQIPLPAAINTSQVLQTHSQG